MAELVSSSNPADLPKRRKITKSRFGCQTCKLKRTKCDERKPICQNCDKKGLQCSYQRSFKFLTAFDQGTAGDHPQPSKIDAVLQSEFEAIKLSSFVDENKATNPSDRLPASDHNSESRVEEVQDYGRSSNSEQTSNLASTDSGADSNIESLTGADPLSLPDVSNVLGTENDFILETPAHKWALGAPASQKDADESTTLLTRPRRSSNHEWSSLLQNYYRMNGFALSTLTLNDEATKLVEHYFRDVCVIYSSFDSSLNPFRTTIGRLWDNSSSIFYSIQSMAAAHMANYIPGMARTGLIMQRKAYECMQDELRSPSTHADKLLLSILLLGLTACWHDSSDLGFAHLSAARALIRPRLLTADGNPRSSQYHNDQFFAEALIYWEMIMSFVSPEPVNEPYRQTTSFSGSGSTTLEDDGATEKKIVPHPWSGVAPRIQMLFAEVGRLLRYVYTPSLATTVPAQVETLLKSAKELEEELLSADIPGPDDIVDTGDARTSKQDFIIIADVTRCSALLEIYRVFPNLLQSRLGGGIPFAFGSSIEALDDFDYEAEPSRWLTSFAIYILENLGKIPSSSGTRPLQLILLNVCANELRLSSVHASSADLGDVMAQNIQTYNSRSFVMSRLLELSTRLPAKPVLKIIDLIKEVWRRSDLGENLFWMEIMNQNGWQTVMG